MGGWMGRSSALHTPMLGGWDGESVMSMGFFVLLFNFFAECRENSKSVKRSHASICKENGVNGRGERESR